MRHETFVDFRLIRTLTTGLCLVTEFLVLHEGKRSFKEGCPQSPVLRILAIFYVFFGLWIRTPFLVGFLSKFGGKKLVKYQEGFLGNLEM